MKPLLQLHLEDSTPKPETPTTPGPECEEPKPMVPSKRLNRIVNRAAHKAATEFSRNSSGIFSK